MTKISSDARRLPDPGHAVRRALARRRGEPAPAGRVQHRGGRPRAGVALGSEIFKLSEAERGQVTRIVVDQARGRVPVVINTGAPGTELAVLYSRTAEEDGADALMVMPPSFMPAGPAEVRAVLPRHLRRRRASRSSSRIRRQRADLAGAGPPDRRGERAGALHQGGERCRRRPKWPRRSRRPATG